MKKGCILFLMLVLVAALAACTGIPPAGEENGTAHSELLIAYDSQEGIIQETAALLQETLGGDLYAIEEGASGDFTPYEFVLLGFSAESSNLPQTIQSFLLSNSFGAKTIYPFVFGEGNEASAIFSVLSQLQPGALLGDSALLFTADTKEEEITEWARGLGLSDLPSLPESPGSTVSTASVTPDQQQVLYLWDKGNMPAVTEYTVNHGGYSDDPDFRPYLTSFPVPEGTPVKGAVLICPGGAFQFRSDQPEGVEVAEALRELGYQSFVVDYRLRPYTQQDSALDLARSTVRPRPRGGIRYRGKRHCGNGILGRRNFVRRNAASL